MKYTIPLHIFFSLYTYYNMEKDLCKGLYTSLFCVIIPTLFPYFLRFWYPYILLHFKCFLLLVYIQVAELASLAQLLPPCSPTVRNPAPDSSLKSCFSPIASASAAARRLRPLQPLLPGPIAASASTESPFASASSCCSR